MRSILSLALLLVLPALAPLALAEEWEARAGGMTMGFRSGVTGFQFGEQSAIGVRYWSNATVGADTTLLLTTCYTSGSGSIAYCERHRLTA